MVRPEEVDSVEEIGLLGDEPVKLIKMIGGFHIATAKVRGNDKALSMGSHAAIVRHNLEKTYGSTFKPHMMKSEQATEPVVYEKTSFLSKNLSDKGYALHLIDESGGVSAILSHFGIEVIKQEALIKTDSVDIKPEVSFSDAKKAKTAIDQGFSKSLIMAIADMAKNMGLDKVGYLTAPTAVKVDKIVKK